VRLVLDEKQSSSHLRELKAKSHNPTTVSKSRPSLGAMKSASEVVENVFIGSMVVLGRVVDTSGVISFELVAQEEKIRDTANAPNSFFILLEQFTSIVEYLYQHGLLRAKTCCETDTLT
tara:strand:- start:14 stop:370 length:357 start_codon:yes stop_codon:yes gene_type:complete